MSVAECRRTTWGSMAIVAEHHLVLWVGGSPCSSFSHSMAYVDKNLTCRDCSAPFVFSAGQQEFFAEKGFENEPSRCKECQTAKKNTAGGGGGWGGGGGGYGGGGQAAFPWLAS